MGSRIRGRGLLPGARLLPPALALAAALSAPALRAQPAEPYGGRGRLVAAIDGMARALVREDSIPGLGLAVVLGFDVLVARGYGLANVERSVPVTAETVFRIGSVTKQFTAAAILQLVEEGKVRLDDEVTRHLPDYPAGGGGITVRRLLNHTSGIRNYTELPDFYPRWSRWALSDDELVAVFEGEPPDFEPGAGWHYSNSGYYLLGMIVEAASGRPYREYLRERVLRPLGLTHTYYCDNGRIIPHRAAGYDWAEGRVVNAAFIHMNTPGAAGALCSTPLDLVRWTRALHGGRVVSPESLRAMLTPEGPAREPGRYVEWARGMGGYGFGLFVSELAGHREIHHPGGINGFVAELAYYPDDDLVVAVLVNTTHADPVTFARRIAARVLGIPESAIPAPR